MNVLETFKLNGKVAIVTGGYGHLGAAMTEALYEAGATVIVAGKSEERFNHLFENTPAVYFCKVDLSDMESVKKCFSSTYQKYGSIDVLVNNAVYLSGGGKRPENVTDEDWQISMEGVMNCVFKSIREVVPFMKNGGSIINIASMYGVVVPNLSMYDDVCAPYLNPIQYGVAKAGVVQMTKYFGMNLIEKGIRVNSVSPGTFPSPKVQENREFVRRLKENNPAHRIGVPDDLKGVIVFLASDTSSYVVGQNIMVDGGWTIW